jgi:hypothetical protein
MTQKIIIGNLPPDVTVDELARLLVQAGADDPEITLNNEGNLEKVTAVLALGDLDRPAADKIVDRIRGRLFRGRTLTAYVPLFT